MTSAPAAGQYSVAGGVYTFAAADQGKMLLINYTYALAGAGQHFTVTNQLLGTTPTFQAQFYTTFQGNAVNVRFNNCTSSKLGFGTKLEDFVMPEFDFSVFADAAGTVATWSFGMSDERRSAAASGHHHTRVEDLDRPPADTAAGRGAGAAGGARLGREPVRLRHRGGERGARPRPRAGHHGFCATSRPRVPISPRRPAPC